MRLRSHIYCTQVGRYEGTIHGGKLSKILKQKLRRLLLEQQDIVVCRLKFWNERRDGCCTAMSRILKLQYS